MKEPVTHGLNMVTMGKFISLDHGSGGRKTHKLISEVFAGKFGIEEPMTDSAIRHESGTILAFTTDSYVVDPLFFPGGNIGKLAVCGTVNDLAVSGALPKYLSAAFIIEEGFGIDKLSEIAESMSEEAITAGIMIVAGDTKVVEKGKCDKLFITTAGIGILKQGLEHISTGVKIAPGDKILLNGSLGNHEIAVLGARKELSFNTPVESDCACLNHIIGRVMEYSDSILFMRDLTRGGLATALNELSAMTGREIIVDEVSVPVDDPVRGLCEMLGFDPLYLANEGKMIIVVRSGKEHIILDAMKKDPLGRKSEIIGEVSSRTNIRVLVNTLTGGKRILEMHSGSQLPRIC
jgi:hydrogenase expression/formation protein HypE